MKSTPLKYHGGKSYLADRIIELMPPHRHYVEPYFGGGAVLFAKPKELVECHSELVNDIDGLLVNFWSVIADERRFPRFCRMVEATPFSEKLWRESSAMISNYKLVSLTRKDTVEWALYLFVMFRQSRQGLGESFATMSRSRTRRGMNEQVSSWLTAVEGLPEAHERLKRVVISSCDAYEIIGREDSGDTFFYCDPPYLQSTRQSKKCYRFEMTEEQHMSLLGRLGTIEGCFILSGYRSDLYDTMANKFGWDRVDIEIDNKASSKKSKSKVVECLWKNY